MSTDKIRCVLDAGANWLACRVNEGTVQSASPIGFYFAKLWYFERLYPTIFALGGLAKWQNWAKRKVATGGNAPG